MADPAIGLAHHLAHALFNQPARAFEPAFVEIGGDLDRLAPKEDAAAEGQGDVKPVPGCGDMASTRRVGDRHDRHLRQPRDIDDTGAGAHRWAARTVRRNRNAIPLLQPLQHSAQRRRTASPRRTGNCINPEIGNRVGDNAAVAMRRDQHVHACHPSPAERDHHHAPVPEGADKRPAGSEQPTRKFLVLDGPSIRPINELEYNNGSPSTPHFAPADCAASDATGAERSTATTTRL